MALNREDPSIAGFVVGVASEAQRHPELGDLLAPCDGDADFLQRLVRDAVDAGELADDVDPPAVEDLLNAVLSGLARFSNQTGDSERHARAVAVVEAVPRRRPDALTRPVDHAPNVSHQSSAVSDRPSCT